MANKFVKKLHDDFRSFKNLAMLQAVSQLVIIMFDEHEQKEIIEKLGDSDYSHKITFGFEFERKPTPDKKDEHE